MKEQCFFVRDVKRGKGVAALSRERRDVSMCREGEEEDGEWGMMGHRHPGKNPWKVCHALLLMGLVQLQIGHRNKTVHVCMGI